MIRPADEGQGFGQAPNRRMARALGWIERFYNPTRQCSIIGYAGPVDVGKRVTQP